MTDPERFAFTPGQLLAGSVVVAALALLALCRSV